jgi:hypothetical protein
MAQYEGISRTPASDSLGERWKVAFAAMLFAGILALNRENTFPRFSSDLDQLLYAARALRAGLSPYDVVGPGKEFDWPWSVFYPLPAIIIALPFSFIPAAVAHGIFSMLAGGVLGFAMGSKWRMLWPLFLSEAFFLAITRNQWSPLVLASIWMPMFGFFLSAKPNIGVVGLAGQRRDSVAVALSLAIVLVFTSFAVRPSWFAEWLFLARDAPNKEIALLQPAGFLLLGSLILWRSMEGRILLAMAIIPQTPSVYDVLLFFALCQSTRQAVLLSILSHVLQWSVVYLGPYPNQNAYYDSLAPLSVWIVHIPAMSLALLRSDTIQQRLSAVSVRARDILQPLEKFVDFALVFLLFFAFALNSWLLS